MVTISWFHPRWLEELFQVFERVEKGEAVALSSAVVAGSGEAGIEGRVSREIEQGKIDVRGDDSGWAGERAWLGLTSSGSTGRPKLIWRRWSELRPHLKTTDQYQGWVWASPYQPSSFAGVQVALQAWVNKGQLISLGSDWESNWNRLRKNRVEALSCTPTFADLLLQHEPQPRGNWSPQQITLGGEVLRPGISRRLVERFPFTRFTLVYATAELGVLLKTQRLDGWYELNSLKRDYSAWRVNAGSLEVCNHDHWHKTGDLVELRGDLIRVLGRADAVANIAGTKIDLTEIAELAEQVPGIRRAVAVTEPSPVTGQIICLKYAVDPASDARLVTEALEIHLRKNLRKEAWPRRWEHEEVGLANNAKRIVR